MKIIVVAFLAFLQVACVNISMSPEGSKVRLTSNPETIRGCKYVALVKGTDHMNGGLAGQGAAEENAMRKIRNKAAEIGADTVMFYNITTGFSGSAVRGEAYKCK